MDKLIRKMNYRDRDNYIEMSEAFYSSDAVLHKIPRAYLYKTFDMVISGSPYTDGYIFEYKGETAGYGLLSFSYSNEAGGIDIWIEEIFLKPEYRSMGFGKRFFDFIDETYPDKARIRLEVEKSNERAIQLYEKLGYGVIGYVQMFKEFNRKTNEE